jgi:hypothetical protein
MNFHAGLTERFRLVQNLNASRLGFGLLLWAAISLAYCKPFCAAAAHGEEKPDAVSAFKDFLRQAPCIKEIRFTKIQRDPAPQYTYLGAICGTDFFIRPSLFKQDAESPSSNADAAPRGYFIDSHGQKIWHDVGLPISYTNRAPPGYFGGSHGQKTWTVSGLQITEAHARLSPTNFHTIQMERTVDELRIILAMGSHLIEPGSCEWNGNRFKAKATRLLRDSSHKADVVEGEILVRDGFVEELLVSMPISARVKYKYRRQTELPLGVPSELIWGESESDFTWRYLIEKMEITKQINDAEFFEPYRHIDQALVGVTLISNEMRFVVQDNTRAVVAAAEKARQRPSVLGIFVVRFMLIAFSFALFVWLYGKLVRKHT